MLWYVQKTEFCIPQSYQAPGNEVVTSGERVNRQYIADQTRVTLASSTVWVLDTCVHHATTGAFLMVSSLGFSELEKSVFD